MNDCRPRASSAIVPSCRSRKSGWSSAGRPGGIKRSFGAKSALDYLIGEKLITFAKAAEDHPEFAKELPRFLGGRSRRVFNDNEIAGYVATRADPPQDGVFAGFLDIQ